MLKKAYILSCIICCVNTSIAQTTFLSIGSEDNQVLDRLETRSGRLCDSLALADKPESRRNAVHFLESLKPVTPGSTSVIKGLSSIDLYNMQQMISENGEWAANEDGAINSKHSWFNTFYVKQYDLAHVKTKDFFVVVNPVISGMVTEQHNDPAPRNSISNTLYQNSHGLELRGWICKKLGFYTSITDNQENFPYYVNNLVSNPGRQVVPGADFFLLPATVNASYDYMQASGYIDFDAIKDHVNIIFGNGKHFIGDGITSLFLSDYSSNIPFLQLQTRIWKIDYECLYLELTPQYGANPGTALLLHKYSTIHYLSWNTFKWLNLGFFEAEVFDRPDVYEVSYLNPIIFSTAVNRFNGSGDKSLLGMSAKSIIAKHVQLYGQFVLDEFKSSQFFGDKGWYGNKWGVQAGAKYFDALGIKNLDLQAEFDAVRPYTYAARDTLDNYTNYNQPLADPLGSGFIRTVGVIKYQPVKNVYLTLKATYYIQGVDTGSANLGNDIFNPYLTAESQYGVHLINGPRNHCEIISLNISYQLRRNIFVDLGGTYRKYTDDATQSNPEYSTTGPIYGPLTTQYVYFGIRINAPRREYDFF
jgi:hypothetical protein